MTLQAKIFLNLLAGAVAGVLAWMITDLTGWFHEVLIATQFAGLSSFEQVKFYLYGAVFGGVLGLLLGIVEGLSMDSSRRLITMLAVATIVGLAGGWLALIIAQSVFNIIAPPDTDLAHDSAMQNALMLLARAVGWSIMGTIIGAAQGLARRSRALARQAAFGGFIGGALGGMVFQVSVNLTNIPMFGRFCALVATGALVGFFVGLVPNLFKQAWIRVVLGRNEGKEYLIARPVTTIGRSELSDIGLFGDARIAPTHVVIEALAQQKRHRLRHVASNGRAGAEMFAPTIVNGQQVNADQWLVDGDTIQIGHRTLLFREKATRHRPPPIEFGVATGANGPARGDSARPAFVMPPEAGITGQYIPAGQSDPIPVEPTTPRVSLTPDSDVLDQMGLPPDQPLPMPEPQAAAQGFSGVGRRLVCIAGPYSGQSFPVGHLPLSIGRGPTCELPLPADTSVSRHHARISYSVGRHILSDIESSNGIYVNNKRVDGSQALIVGDIVKLGDTRLRYE